jgi:hypothetical protein
LRFEFFPLRFDFIARDSLYFAPGQAANILRGAMGTVLAPAIFRPAVQNTGPSGLADSPRPFVFRARHLDGVTIQSGQWFHFDLNVFSLEQSTLEQLVRTFEELAREGFGPGRGKAVLQNVTDRTRPTALDLTPRFPASNKIRVDFLSPTELKHEERIADRPDFPILFGRIRDRISTLRALYGPGPLEIDFQAAGQRAASVAMSRCEVRRVELRRRSRRTGQTHSIGGFVGMAEYEGELAEFLPYLEAARWTGVGRHAVWGNGEIAVTRF